MNFNENLLFLRSFMQNPKKVGSIVPSSRFLAERMVKHAPWHNMTAVAELGSGTGAITGAIHSNVQKTTKVLLFEMNETMRNNLQSEYPHFSCHANAAQLVTTMKEADIKQLDCVISGLPFFNFEQELRERLVGQIVEALKPGGLFIAFQYSLQMKKQLAGSFSIEKIEFEPFNIPPAFVYICRKQDTI